MLAALHMEVSPPVIATGAANTVTVVVLVAAGQGPVGVFEVKVRVVVPGVKAGVYEEVADDALPKVPPPEDTQVTDVAAPPKVPPRVIACPMHTFTAGPALTHAAG